jgi:hypothetical protein
LTSPDAEFSLALQTGGFHRHARLRRPVLGQPSGQAVTRDEKRRQLAELRQTLAGMKAHASPALRASITAKIAALEAELGERKG